MATNLVAVGNQAPGFYGLNLQESSTVLDPQWASEAMNAVITSDGRIGTRNGWLATDTLAGTIRALHSEYKLGQVNPDILACANNTIYHADSPYTAFTSLYSTAITADSWHIENFNGDSYFFQIGQAPLIYNTVTEVVTLLSAKAGFGDSSDSVIATEKPNTVHAAFGRLWVADGATTKQKVWWSDSLSGHIWNSGSAGSLDLHTVLQGDTDDITTIHSFQNKLVIFLKNNILIYSGAESTPASNLTLVEQISGIGCIARDSIQNIGSDLVFLSSSGVRSLLRTLQEFNSPLRDLSKNVRDNLVTVALGETSTYIKSTYSAKHGFYLLSFPTFNKVYCFDMRAPLQDGSARVTIWDNITPTAMVTLSNEDIYVAKGADIGKYEGYTDNGSSYSFYFATPWLDYGQPFNIKMLKNFYILAEVGASMTITVEWAVDFRDSFNSTNKTTAGATSAEWNLSEYNIDEFGYGFTVDQLQGTMGNSGKVVKLRVSVPITNKFNMKKYEIYAKAGRTV
jgi:hypothetical protein